MGHLLMVIIQVLLKIHFKISGIDMMINTETLF
jgi:hypothetical protein